MESTTESDPKKMSCKIRILRVDTLDNLVNGRGIAVQIKHIIKDKLGYESSQLQLMEKQNNSTLKTLDDSVSSYPFFENFKEKYQAYMKSSVILQQDIVSRLSEVEGPYEMMKRWLDAPTTKNKPEELKKQHSNLCDDHASKITLLKKEKKTLTKISEQLTTCQRKLQDVQAALRISVQMGVNISGRQIKEQRTLRGLEKELISHFNKSLKQCQTLVIEEEESRKYLQKGMARLAAEIKSFEEERVRVSNAAMNKFVWILNQQETHRDEKKQATCDLIGSISIDLPKVSLKNKEIAHFYKFPDFAEQLREMGFSQMASAPETVYKAIVESQDTSNTVQDAASSSNENGEETRKPSKTTRGNASNKKPKQEIVEDEEEKQPKKVKKGRKAVNQDESTEVQELNRTTSPQPVEHEEKPEKPKRKLPKPPQNKGSDDEDDAPPRVRKGWASSEEEEEEVTVSDVEQDTSKRDAAPSFSHGVPLQQSRPLKALLTHKSSDNSHLSFEKGQKLVQTHKASEEGIAYGYTRKHSYSKVKYGYFNIGQMRTWKPTARNTIKNLFRI